MEEKSVLKTWWSVMGKWQVLAVFAVFAVFHTALYVSGGHIGIATLVACLVTITVFVPVVATSNSSTEFIASAAITAIVALLGVFDGFLGAISTLIPVAVLTVLVAMYATVENIKGSVVIASSVAEYIAVLSLTLATARGWW